MGGVLFYLFVFFTALNYRFCIDGAHDSDGFFFYACGHWMAARVWFGLVRWTIWHLRWFEGIRHTGTILRMYNYRKG
ncbi:hypothetical protein BZA05DRAFT_393649 [Tricharina praecox]|uniref:uncharacterized protein n=1 Tax=Tricharina praecox TaxID=43433 RepID=UPI002220FD73|nr:uncharacterized protein BZA05DRAFT_393649 [Tricharina praecox]KAI5854247.1 hypothetical protein BZA05DRAFT_393649 [Tricharina praecox]